MDITIDIRHKYAPNADLITRFVNKVAAVTDISLDKLSGVSVVAGNHDDGILGRCWRNFADTDCYIHLYIRGRFSDYTAAQVRALYMYFLAHEIGHMVDEEHFSRVTDDDFLNTETEAEVRRLREYRDHAREKFAEDFAINVFGKLYGVDMADCLLDDINPEGYKVDFYKLIRRIK